MDSNGSLTHITYQEEPVDEILDIIKDETEVKPEVESCATEASIASKRRSSFAASFYSSQPMSERSLRRSSGRVSYMEDPQDIIEEEALDVTASFSKIHLSVSTNVAHSNSAKTQQVSANQRPR